ncbi:MAG: CTP synthase [Pseudomonas sp.]|uniref:CTP synthase C-terminal region-related (seleno)protein n=1 Tax=Pseudomonas sp. TaxID=306 RepID=UPI00339B654E
MRSLNIGLIGDHDASVIAHQAIPPALQLAAAALDVNLQAQWLPTEHLDSDARLRGFDGLWAVPATPYRDMDGALLAIRFARERGVPFLGTCGGFQHALIEYARHQLGWADAEHAETAPEGARLVIAPLSCALVEVQGNVRFSPTSRLALAYGSEQADEGYHCRFGLNPAFSEALASGPLRITAVDGFGDARALELDDHPFFVGTLFQPERAALKGEVPPLVKAFVQAVVRHAQT